MTRIRLEEIWLFLCDSVNKAVGRPRLQSRQEQGFSLHRQPTIPPSGTGGPFTGSKATRARSCPFTFLRCRDLEYMELGFFAPRHLQHCVELAHRQLWFILRHYVKYIHHRMFSFSWLKGYWTTCINCRSCLLSSEIRGNMVKIGRLRRKRWWPSAGTISLEGHSVVRSGVEPSTFGIHQNSQRLR
jgi:hypothetical protein